MDHMRISGTEPSSVILTYSPMQISLVLHVMEANIPLEKNKTTFLSEYALMVLLKTFFPYYWKPSE